MTNQYSTKTDGLSTRKVAGILLAVFIAGCNVVSNSPTATPIEPSPTYTASLPSTNTPTYIQNQSVNPTITLTPTITSTPECTNSLVFYRVAFFNSNVQLSYDTPFDLSQKRTFENEKLTANLTIPDLRVVRNGIEISDYNAFLGDPNRPGRLYLTGAWDAGDVIMIEILQGSSRFCSFDYEIPAKLSLPTQTPAPELIQPADEPKTIGGEKSEPIDTPKQEPTQEPIDPPPPQPTPDPNT